MATPEKTLREKFPMTAYPENHWEIYDEVEARVVAFFFSEAEAHEYLGWKNAQNGCTTTEISEDVTDDA